MVNIEEEGDIWNKSPEFLFGDFMSSWMTGRDPVESDSQSQLALIGHRGVQIVFLNQSPSWLSPGGVIYVSDAEPPLFVRNCTD